MAGFTPLQTVVGGTDEEPSGFKPLQEVDLGQAPKRNALAAGLSSGVDQLQGLSYSAGAAVADAFGAKTPRDWLNERAWENEVDARINGRPDLERIEDQTPGSILPYIGYQALKQAPMVAGAIAAGAIAPEAAVPAALTRIGAVAPRFLGGGALGAAEGYAAKKAAVQAGQTFGRQIVGGLAFNEGQAIGSLYQEAKDNPELSNPGLAAIAASPAYALAETLPEAMLAGRFAHGSGFSGNFLSRTAKSMGTQSLTGATSELAQTGMETAIGAPKTAEEIKSNFLNAGVAGGLVEGLFGAAGGFKGARTAPQTPALQTSTSQIALPDQPGGEVQQAFASSDAGTSSIMEAGRAALMSQATDPLAGRAPLTTETANYPQPQATVGQVPGTTDVAQASQQAAAAQQQQAQAAAQEDAQVQAKLKEQANREQAFATVDAKPTTGPMGDGVVIFGQPILGPAAEQFGTELARKLSAFSPIHHTLTQAIAQAHAETTAPVQAGEKPTGLVKFNFNGANVHGSVKNLTDNLSKAFDKLQIGHAQTVEQAAAILNKLSETAKKADLEYINAVHAALTGEDTAGFIAATAAQPKGAKNGQLQLQNDAGIRDVREQGGAGETSPANAGTVRPGNVQPLESGSQPEGSLGLQVGQPTGSGVRTGPSGTPADNGVGNAGAVPQAQVNPTELLRGLVNGGFGPGAANSVEDRKLNYAMVDKIVSDGLASGKFNVDILDQIDRTTNQSLSGAAITELDRYLTATRKGETYATGQTTPAAQGTGQVVGQAQAGTVGTNGNQQRDATAAENVSERAAGEGETAEVTDATGQLLRNVLGMVFRSNKKVEFLATFIRKQNDVTYDELGARLGLAENTIRKYQKLLSIDKATGLPIVIADNLQKFQQALNIQAGLMNVDVAELRASLNDLVATEEAAALEEHNEADLAAQGFAIQNRTERKDAEGKGTGKSDLTNVSKLNEEGNKAEALSQQYTDTLDALDAAEQREDSAEVDVLKAQLDKLEAEIAVEVAKEKAKVKAKAGKVVAEKQTGLTGELSNAERDQGRDETNPLESDYATEEQGAGALDVEEQPENGGAVGEGNTEPQKPAGKGRKQKAPAKVKTEPVSETKEVDLRTDDEKAGAAWDDAVKEYPTAPKWADLTDAQRKTFVEYGEDNWTAEDVQGELVKLAKAGQAKASTTPTSATVLDFKKYVYHAVRSDEDLKEIMQHGIRPGTNVSIDHNGQAFSGEGDTILVLPKGDAKVTGKGYQNDGVVEKRVYPVAILKDTSTAPTQSKDEANEQLGAQYDNLSATLKGFAKTLSLSKDEFDAARWKLSGKRAFAAEFGDEYGARIYELTREENSLFSAMEAADSLPETVSNPLQPYAQYGVPVFGLSIKFNQSTEKNTLQITNDNVIDVEARVIDETVGPQVLALAAPQINRLEKHYGVKSDSAEFLAKVKEDVVKYATKGAEAVSAAIRDIIKAIHSGVLAVAMIFNPMHVTTPESVVVTPKATTETVERVVQAKVPAKAKSMSPAGQQAYATLIPALKGKNGDKLITIADKPSGQIFVFDADGKLITKQKALFGHAKGDLYVGNNDLPKNRITPAGLFGLKLVDAAEGGASAKTAGEYDFGKVFALEDPDAVVTIMHSVWLHESDAKQRAAALKNDNPADSRYSFGCINVDKDTYKMLLDKYQSQMDGSKLFVVPDDQTKVKDFLEGNVPNDRLVREGVKPTTETVTRTTGSATRTASAERAEVGKEEDEVTPRAEPIRAVRSRDMGDFDGDLSGVIMNEISLEDLEDNHPRVADALDELRDDGLSYLIRRVGKWFTADAGDKFGMAFTFVDGEPAIIVNTAAVTKENGRFYLAHELGHLADTALVTNTSHVFSGIHLFGVLRANDGTVTATGVVSQEILEYYKSNPESSFADTMAYPLSKMNMGRMDTQSEIFAQLWAMWSESDSRQFLRDNLPLTATFMETAYEVTQTQQARTETTISDKDRRRQTEHAVQKAAAYFDRPRQPEAIQVRFGKGVAFNPPTAFSAMPKALRSSAELTWTNMFRNAALPLMMTEDVVALAKKYMRSAPKYLESQFKRMAERIRVEGIVDGIIERFEKLPAEVQKQVNKYIFDSTMNQSWGYYPGAHRVGTTLFEVDDAYRARFEAIEARSPEAAQLIKDTFEHGYQMLLAKQKAVHAMVDREFADREKAAIGDVDALQALAKEKKAARVRASTLMNIQVDKPYAYLARYGDFIVVAKSKEFKHFQERAALKDADYKQAEEWLKANVSNPDHYVVQFAETQGEADRIAADLMSTGKYDIQADDAGPKEANGSYTGGDAFVAVKRLMNMVGRGGEADPHMEKLLSELYLATISEASARKSEIQRKYVAGANDNMMRNLATSGRADAHFLSTVTYNDEITESLEAMRAEATNNRRDAMPLYNEVYARYNKGLDYDPAGPLVKNLTRTTSIWNLAMNPAYYLQQLLQTEVLSVPYMAGRIGYFRAQREMGRAYREVAALVKGLKFNDHVDFNSAAIPSDVRPMLQKLVGMGKIDIGIEAESKALAGETTPLAKVMRKLQGVNNRIETINRTTAAIAAYRGYLRRYGSEHTEAATQFAADVVSNTHGSYDGFNTPRALNNTAGRVFGQFKRFQIIQLSMLAKTIHTAFKGSSQEEKVIARRALGFITAHMAVLGGALGIPFVSQIGSILLGLFGGDEPDDLETYLRRAINDEAVADLLLRGVPSAVGLESLGKKLAMENVASLTPFVDFDLSSRSGMEKTIIGMMGPSVSLGLKFADGIGMMAQGSYYKGLEQMMPSGIANAMKGIRMGTEGLTMRNGDTVMGAEELTMLDAAFQAVGLPTNTITDRQRLQSVVKNTDKFYQDASTEIKNDYTKAFKSGDSEAMASARDAWAELQASRRAHGYQVQPLSNLFKAPMEQRKRERNVAGGVEFNKGNRTFVQQQSNQ